MSVETVSVTVPQGTKKVRVTEEQRKRLIELHQNQLRYSNFSSGVMNPEKQKRKVAYLENIACKLDILLNPNSPQLILIERRRKATC